MQNGRKELARNALLFRQGPLFKENERGLRRDYLLGLTRKFRFGWLKVASGRGRLKVQLGQVLSLGLLTQGLNISDVIWGQWFSF